MRYVLVAEGSKGKAFITRVSAKGDYGLGVFARAKSWKTDRGVHNALKRIAEVSQGAANCLYISVHP